MAQSRIVDGEPGTRRQGHGCLPPGPRVLAARAPVAYRQDPGVRRAKMTTTGEPLHPFHALTLPSCGLSEKGKRPPRITLPPRLTAPLLVP